MMKGVRREGVSDEALLPIALVLAEEIGREIGEVVAERLPRPREAVTKTFRAKSVLVDFELDILNVRCGGRLRELLVVSPSPDFRFVFVADGVARLDGDFAEFMAISEGLTSLSAFQSAEGKYVFHLKGVRWLSEAMCFVRVRQPIRFDHVFAMWDEFV